MMHFRSRNNTRNEAGFTIVELMIATVVFSTILTIITSGVIQFTKSYYRGVHDSATQAAARNIMSRVAVSIQYGGGTDIDQSPEGDAEKYLCVGDVQLDYKLGEKYVSGAVYGAFLTKINGGSCSVYSAGLVGQELLSPNMRLLYLKVTPVNSGLFAIKVGVAYGDDDLLCNSDISPTDPEGCNSATPIDPTTFNWEESGPDITCRSGAGSQFCAVAKLSTQVVNRRSQVLN